MGQLKQGVTICLDLGPGYSLPGGSNIAHASMHVIGDRSESAVVDPPIIKDASPSDPRDALPDRSWHRYFQKTALSWVCRSINFHKLNTLFNQQIKKQIILPSCPHPLHPVPLVPPPVAVHPPGSWAHRFIQAVFELNVNGIMAKALLGLSLVMCEVHLCCWARSFLLYRTPSCEYITVYPFHCGWVLG